ncbi:MAG: lysine--tRNA ligase [Chloroflexota bacterium]
MAEHLESSGIGHDRLRDQRVEKLRELRDQLGYEPYPARVPRTHTTRAVLDGFLDDEQTPVTVAGRIVGGIRGMGKSTFLHIQDGEGRLQLYFKSDVLGPELYNGLLKQLDIGDFVHATGTPFKTRAGEITVGVADFGIAAKALRPLPEKWHGLSDVETRYRQRYLDLTVNRDVYDLFLLRGRAIQSVREHLHALGFLEVETPVLQPLPGGAAARPFETHYNALDRMLYLRIALELYLKRCIIGGYERVYEIGRVFRNEGVSAKHNPEFTMLELYQAYADYRDIMELTETLVAGVAERVLGSTQVQRDEAIIELRPPWTRLSLRDAILEHSGVDYEAYDEVDELRTAAKNAGLPVDPTWNRAKVIDELLSVFVEPKLIQPTFLIGYPVELSPLAKRNPDRSNEVERFEGFIGGMEIANAFSELNDPLDQAERFREQAAMRAAGDDEAQLMDQDFLEALEYGMPPTGGLGIGIDRLIMILTGKHSIREVVLFPQLRTRV